MELDAQIVRVICKELNIPLDKIQNIIPLKKGMTNHSFSFLVDNKKYIMRVPGEGTQDLINRTCERDVYAALKGLAICDNVIFIDGNRGYKISEYIQNSRVCDPYKYEDVKDCMKKLREFHNLNITVNHVFDLRVQIEFYERLFGGNKKSSHENYMSVKKNVFQLFDYVEKMKKHWSLCHIDSVPDNFLFTEDGNIRLIDWEYAGMQDADVDIAMFAIYSLYDRNKIEQLINAYYEEGCSDSRKLKIYCYIAIGGLLWSNWCEYKQLMGVKFGKYAQCQYDYAIEYYKVFQEEVSK